MKTTMLPRKSDKKLVESIHSLLGLKKHFTSAWVTSVCDIVKNLPSEGPSSDCTIASENIEETGSDEVDLGKEISKIRDELAATMASIHLLNIQRREVLNKFLNLKGNIRVFCRVRPITMENTFGNVIALDSSNVLLKLTESKSKRYNFDGVFHPGSSQDEVFSEVEPVIKSVLDGYNACIFAFGQTGTGKTFTMEGTPDCPGVVAHSIESLFKQAVDSNYKFLFGFSMLEIYLGNLKDLLAPQSLKAAHPMPPCLSIQTDPTGGIKIENLVTIHVSNFNQALRLYELGSRLRSTASTNSNINSSRSHCMIRITITCFDAPMRRKEMNKLWMVDLGGSERMLKTKAWGRRLEEGKAINLSLSALGDVINALQKRKCHIPYRNSKLTQVLIDSLGEDSKTLMLVHVSPKEEDLCETTCSLNFATRVRSTHLEHKETAEQRDQKELAMTNLLQKMTRIEDERQYLRRDIKNLNERLDVLTRETPSSRELVNASHLFTEVPHSNIENMKNGNKDLTATPLQLPRFMRSTLCSRKKSGIGHHTLKEHDPVPARRRRSSSHHAKSVTFPLNNTSEYNSEGSISRASCLVALNMKCGEDDDTESSQETSECDIKLVDFMDQEKPPWRSIRQKPHLNNSNGYGNQQRYKFNSSKFCKVDDWFHLQKNGPSIISHASGTKRVLAIPTTENKIKCTGHNKAGKLQDEKVHTDEFRKKIINHDKTEKLVDADAAGKDIDKASILLKDFVSMSSESNFIYPSHTIDAKIMMQRQVPVSILPKEDNESGPFPPAKMWYDRYYQDYETNRILSILVSGKTQCSDGYISVNDCCDLSPSDMSDCIVDLIEDSGVSISISELQSGCQEEPTNMNLNVNKKEDMCTFSPDSEKRTRPCLLKLQSQGALFMENANKEDLVMPVIKSQGKTQNTGMCEVLVQKMQTLYASALLGLGFQNLGYDHDFFYGLML